MILTGIKDYDLKLLEWAQKVIEVNKNLKITIKPHPMSPDDNVLILSNLPANFIVKEEKLSSLFEQTRIVISSGPTGAPIESLAYNCFLLVPVIDPIDEYNLKSLKISQKKYSLVYNKHELAEEIKKQINKKYITKGNDKNNLKIRNFLFEKISNKNMRYYY